MYRVRCSGAPSSAAEDFAARSQQVAVATNSNQIRLFELRDMSCQLLFGHTDLVLALDVSADGE